MQTLCLWSEKLYDESYESSFSEDILGILLASTQELAENISLNIKQIPPYICLSRFEHTSSFSVYSHNLF